MNSLNITCSPTLLIERFLNFSSIFLLAHPLMSKPELYIIYRCKSIKTGKKFEKTISSRSKKPNFLKNPDNEYKGFSNNPGSNTFILFLIGIKNGENKSPGKDEKFIIKTTGTHILPSFKFIFFAWGCVPNVSNQMADPLLPKNDAKPRHSQYQLIPGRVSTPGCARGGAILKKIPNSKFQITNKSQIPNYKFQTSAFMSIIYVPLSPTCLLYLIFEESFFNQLKGIVITSEDRAVSGPGFISLKKYPGLLLRGFLFLLAAKEREGTVRKEKVCPINLIHWDTCFSSREKKNTLAVKSERRLPAAVYATLPPEWQPRLAPVFVFFSHEGRKRQLAIGSWQLERKRRGEETKKRRCWRRETSGSNRWVCREEFFTPPHTWICIHLQ
ncbi:MAG: hypothetical protein GTN67_12575, partial [Hydrotalea flava]|nr:hypothetical protein [Hydrotalea flava]NIN04197.1 hypothetical protein [Hydrotalea flava]NIN15870.1 hypothetical protein [Hydrotalea flava]NIO94934.1 hypothetical protein [Hydrotalea flava]NIQ51335.1 hypothetical protein [Hydrotalea flava]